MTTTTADMYTSGMSVPCFATSSEWRLVRGGMGFVSSSPSVAEESGRICGSPLRSVAFLCIG